MDRLKITPPRLGARSTSPQVIKKEHYLDSLDQRSKTPGRLHPVGYKAEPNPFNGRISPVVELYSTVAPLVRCANNCNYDGLTQPVSWKWTSVERLDPLIQTEVSQTGFLPLDVEERVQKHMSLVLKLLRMTDLYEAFCKDEEKLKVISQVLYRSWIKTMEQHGDYHWQTVDALIHKARSNPKIWAKLIYSVSKNLYELGRLNWALEVINVLPPENDLRMLWLEWVYDDLKREQSKHPKLANEYQPLLEKMKAELGDGFIDWKPCEPERPWLKQDIVYRLPGLG